MSRNPLCGHDAQVQPPPSTAARGLCIVGINYAPEPTGIGPYTTFMAEAIREAGVSVRVVTGVPHYPAWSVASEYRRGRTWQEIFNGVEITRVRHSAPSVNGLRGRALMESSFLAAAAPKVRRVDADALIAVTPSVSALAAAIVGCKGPASRGDRSGPHRCRGPAVGDDGEPCCEWHRIPRALAVVTG